METRNIIIKWIKGITTKPLVILKSIYYRIRCKHQNIHNSRLTICNQCEHKLSTKFGDICDTCGCILDNKTRLVEERCDLNKW